MIFSFSVDVDMTKVRDLLSESKKLATAVFGEGVVQQIDYSVGRGSVVINTEKKEGLFLAQKFQNKCASELSKGKVLVCNEERIG